MKCCVYTRFVNELCYLDNFIEHYLRLGFDKIIVLLHDNDEYILNETLQDYVDIHQVENRGNRLPNLYKHLIPKDYDWVLHVDSDELLFLKKSYVSIKDYIIKKLFINPDINVFQFSWLWLHRFHLTNERHKNSLTNIIYEYKTMVGFKDVYSKQVWVKTMTRVKNIVDISCHTFVLNCRATVFINNESLLFDNDNDNNNDNNNDNDNKLNLNYNIEPGLETELEMELDSDSESELKTELDSELEMELDSDSDLDSIHEIKENNKKVYIPRHYRINKFTYHDSFLLHLNSRDIINVFFKGLNIHHSQVQKKRINKYKSLKNFINQMQTDRDLYDKENFTKFIKIVGYKLIFPVECLNFITTLNLSLYNIFNYTTPLCNFFYYENYKQFHFQKFMALLEKKYYSLDVAKLYKFLRIIGQDYDKTFTWTQNN